MSAARPPPIPPPGALPLVVLLAMAVACARAEHAPPGEESRYEGPNFYETGTSQVSVPAPSTPPTYFEVAGDENPVTTCTVRPMPPSDAGVARDPALLCPAVTTGLISDFNYQAGSNASDVTFAPDSSIRGGTYFYPDGTPGLRSDVTGSNWHLTGTVSAISGFGIYLNGCKELDASMYGGIAFSIGGQMDAAGELVFFVGTAENQVSSSWLNENKANPSDADEPPSLGQCVPLSNRYDGSCREARLRLSLTEMPSQVLVRWQDLQQGCPAVSVDPSQITSIAWYFAPAAVTYSVDIHIDDLRFADGGPL
jgi:hypothetical protein